MAENQKPEDLTLEDEQLVKDLSQRTNWLDLLNRARNNTLGVNERVLAVLSAEARSWLYTILAEVKQELEAELKEFQQPPTEVRLRLGALNELPASTLTPTGGGEKERTNCEIRELLAEIGDLHRSLKPPKSEPGSPSDVKPAGGQPAPPSTPRKSKP